MVTPAEPEPPLPEPYTEMLDLSTLLHEVPMKERLKMTEAERTEFTSYLRPVMYEEVFPQLRNGWKFLQLHIKNKDNTLFNKVLTKRQDYD